MQDEDIFSGLEDQLVKVLFFDTEKTRSLHGKLKQVSDNFVKIATLSQEFLIHKKNIIKIQRDLNSDKNETGKK